MENRMEKPVGNGKPHAKANENEMANTGLEGHAGFGANRLVAVPI